MRFDIVCWSRSAVLGLVLAAACAPQQAAPVGTPVPDAAGAAAELARGTVPASPRQISFAWSLNESGSRVRGRGVARFAAPDRLRLDLFGPRNETFLSAAQVGDEVRLPQGADASQVPIPSPSLLWAALGVIRAPSGATVTAATADSVTTLRYQAGEGEVFQYRVRVRQGSPRLEQLERSGASGVLESVQVEYGDGSEVRRIRYRDWSAYRELTLEVENAKDVASFPETIWRP